MRLIKPTVLITFGTLWWFFASAQSLPSLVSLQANPSSPSPGEKVLIEARTPTFDKDSASFSWVINGKARPDLSGNGKNAISMTAGEVGSVTQVSVTVSSAQGTGKENISIRVAELSLIWSAQTYVPKWFKGKALPVQGSTVKISAFPRFVVGGVLVDPEQMVYSWSVDDEDDAVKGVGKKSIYVQLSESPKITQNIKVQVEDRLHGIVKTEYLFLDSVQPKLAIYSVLPLGGIENRISPYSLFSQRGELDLAMEPFYFSVTSKNNLNYDWTVAGNEIQGNLGKPHVLSLNTGSDPSSSVPITATIRTKENFFGPFTKILTLLLR